MPGHQGGKAAPSDFRRFLSEHALAADLTQVLGLDDVHRPVGPTGAAQELAAALYGAEATWFLVNGATCGNQAMLWAALRPGEEVILPRNAHRSVMGAIMLVGARPVYLSPPVDEELGVAHCLTPEQVARALALHPRAAALLVTSPTYHGATADLAALVGLAHARGIPALVDQAWGPHLALHEGLPPCAVAAGADLVVTSTHKLLAGMSQAAMLHFQGGRLDRARVEAAVRLFQSTSPSCLLVASLDVARRQAALHGRVDWDRALQLAAWARAALEELPGVRCPGPDRVGRPGVHGWDPTRLGITVEGYHGGELERWLRAERRIQVELSDLSGVLALVTPGHAREELEALVEALRALPRRARAERAPALAPPPPGPLALGPREASLAPWEARPRGECAGRISAEMITPYPPGIPLACPGERLTPEILGWLDRILAAGLPVQGASDPTLGSLRVLAEPRPRSASAGAAR